MAAKKQIEFKLTNQQRLEAMTVLAAAAMEGIVNYERSRNLPHQMLAENIGEQSVRLAAYTLDNIVKHVNERQG